MTSSWLVPNSYSPAAITPMVAGPSAMPKAMDLTVPSKYSLPLNICSSSKGVKKGPPVCQSGFSSSSALRGQNQWQQPSGIARIGKGAVLLALELQTGQAQGHFQANRAGQLAGFGEAFFQVYMRNLAQVAAQPMVAPFLFELAAVVVAPADPARQLRLMGQQPAFELRPYRAQRRGGGDIGLADLRELTAEVGQVRTSGGPHKALEVLDFMAASVDQAGSYFDDFHLCDRPAAFFGGGFQVYYQPMLHKPSFACREYGSSLGVG